jgi:hypothetical protein
MKYTNSIIILSQNGEKMALTMKFIILEAELIKMGIP